MSGYVVKKAASLREQVVDAVLYDLQAGVIAPGERLTEEGLAQRLNVSRTPIREALAQLSHQGTITAREGGGYIIPFPTPAEIRDIVAVRRLLEPPAVRMAAEEFDPQQVNEITKAINREAGSATSKNAARFAMANKEFREAVFQPISNKALSNAIAQFNPHLHLIRSSTLSDMELRQEIVDRQSRIRDAIAERDPDLAEQLWIDYLDLSEKTLLSALSSWAREKQKNETDRQKR